MGGQEELRLVALTGNLGYGYRLDSLRNGLDASPHMVGADNGSTDPGPYYLGSGDQLTKPAQVKRDLRAALVGARKIGVPLVIGTAGTAGGEPHLQALLEILWAIAREEKLHFRAAVIHAEVPREVLLAALAAGRIKPMPGVPELTLEVATATNRVVGQMGVEPFIQALESGAEVVIAGRACDTAIYAALPILHGYDPGLAYHLAKIMECGAQCAIPLAANDCLLGRLRSDHFLVTPLASDRRVTTESVAAHTLYEQPDPTIIGEPTGHVDISDAEFEQIDPHTVRVSNSRWIPHPKATIKLEGATLKGYRSMALAGARDPAIIANLDVIEAAARDSVAQNLDGIIAPSRYRLRMLVYGRDAVMGRLEPNPDGHSKEVAVVLEAMAPTQEEADTALSIFRSSVLHCPFPGRKTTGGNLAFPFSPSDIRVGPAYEFTVYHLLETDRPGDLFPVETILI